MSENLFQIATFYEFKRLEKLPDVKAALQTAMKNFHIKGTILVAEEGFNSTLCGATADVSGFLRAAEDILQTKIVYKSSFHSQNPFRRALVKIKPEIVTLKQKVDISKGAETHVSPAEWNKIISLEDVYILDTRNDYEYETGTFRGAVNPQTAKFSDLPHFIAENLSPETHKNIAMFCTGGIRCEKFAPYLKEKGFENVYQLEGGILKYLEEIAPNESLWQGECFVFDERISVDENLHKGSVKDFSAPKNKKL